MKAFAKQGGRPAAKTKSQPTSAIGTMHKKSKRQWFGLVLMILVVGSLVLLALDYAITSKKSATGACSDTSAKGILSQAAPVMSQDQYGKLLPIAQKISSLKNYQKDPNCLYIMSVFYLEQGNLMNAQKNINMLSQLPATQLPSSKLTEKSGDLNRLKKRLEILNAQVKQNRSNYLGIM